MPDQNVTAWKCSVCGYIHRQPEPPEWCPVCGSAREAFEPYVEEAMAEKSPVERWRCLNCSYVHSGSAPPAECPVCGSPADRFEPLAQAAEATRATGRTTKVVVVGAGIAGIAAAESLRAASAKAETAS